MKGDFSRFIFDPKKHYTSALMQQGRVLSDADWNVQQSMNQHRVETEAQDVIGLCGVPEDVGGFEMRSLGQPKGLSFINSEQGWMASSFPDDGNILVTTDGGVSWLREDPGIKAAFQDIHFTNSQQGWVIGWKRIQGEINSTTDSVILITTDGGKHWIQQGSRRGESLYGICFVNERQGWAVGYNSESNDGIILTTTDGGQTWTPQRQNQQEKFQGVHFINERQGWVVGFTGSGGEVLSLILVTTDSGQTWTPQRQSSQELLFRVHFINERQGWVAGGVLRGQEADGIILATTDGGATWNTLTSRRGELLWEIVFTNDRQGWLISSLPREFPANGNILTTNDAGQSWVLQTQSNDLLISPGRIYVDGILCETDGGQFTQQPDSPETTLLQKPGYYLLYIDVWQRHRIGLDDPRILEVALGGPDTTTRLQTIWQIKLLEVTAFDPVPTLNLLQKVKDKLQQLESEQRRPGGDRQIAEQLRRGWGLTNSFLKQFPDIAVELRQEQLKNALGELIANLEFLNLQQVNIVAEQGALKTELTRLETSPETATCAMTYPEWDKFTAASTGTLNARTQTPQSDDNPCLLPPTAGFQRLENQLYRFEIHKGGLFKSGSTDTVTGKWSRDNGSVVTAVEKISGHEITVQTVGPDDVLGFANGQWVEIIDDRLELNGQPGEVIQITNVDPATRVITLQTAPAPLSTNLEGIDKVRHPKLRRWDSAGTFPLSSGWIPLEGGIEIQLSEGTYKTGDYWLIPARTIMGEIEWPPYEVPNLNPIPQLPLGIKHHYCRLAILKFADQNLKILEDCRKLFPPLTKVKVDSGIHITEVFALTPNLQPVPLKNDTEIAFEMLTQELRIVCDRPVDRQVFRSNNQLNQPHPACFVTINLPFPTSEDDKLFWNLDLILGYQPVILNAATEVNDRTIFWRPTTTVKEWLQRLNERLQVLPDFRDVSVRILVNLTLKGNFIWAADDPKIYLDGEAFGTSDGETASNLRLPSGDGKRGGDFEMWFWLAPPPPPRLVALQITPDTVQAGSSARGVVTLDKPALAGGVQVSLSSDNNAIASVSASVTIIAGAISAEFTITTSSPGFNTTLPVPINASLATVRLQKVLSVQGPRLG